MSEEPASTEPSETDKASPPVAPSEDVEPTVEGGLAELPFLGGLMLVSGATLALEVLVTRLLSVITWYSLAFLVLGMGMFGLTAGAVRVYLRPDEYEGPALGRSLARDALRFAIAVPISYALLLVVPLRVAPTLTTVVLFVVFAAIVALPFVPAGMVVAAALTKSKLPTGRVYAVDLAGAALGAPLVPELLERMTGGTAILAMSVVGAAAAYAFSTSSSDVAGKRRAVRWGLGLVVLALVNASSKQALVPLWAKGKPEEPQHIEEERWNSHSRVQVSPIGKPVAALWGPGTKCRIPRVKQRMMMIDADAATPLYTPEQSLEELRFLDCDVTNVAHHLRPGGAAAIIGVGGSRDIQAALLFQHAPVVGIELNRRLLEILRGPMGQGTLVPQHPDVRLVHDDARSWLSRTNAKFRFIQASLIDTWAATGAGAHALGENGLYTVEAWRTFLGRLEPDGIVTMSRWSSGETTRIVAVAMAALLEDGVKEPGTHVALVASGLVTTIIVGKSPLTADDAETLRKVAQEKGFEILLAPGMKLPEGRKLTEVLRATSRAELDRVTLTDDLDLRPSTDERPFFFNVLRLRSFLSPSEQQGGTIEGNRLATRTLLLSLLASVVLSVLTIAWPLYTRAKPRGRVGTPLWAGLAYFGLIGVGFMLAEVGLLMRLSIVLGHPSYSLIVVLASLIASAGLGSYLSDRLAVDERPLCFVYPVVIAVILLGLAAYLPEIAPKVQVLETRARIAIAGGITSVMGVALGFAFPTGMRIVQRTQMEETPWLWGINGIGGVLASSVAVIVALEAGLRSLFVVAAVCYLGLLPAIAVLLREERRAEGS